MTKRLLVRVDGEAMTDLEARAFWERFSAHMEAHRGDLAGFAAKEGFASVHPSLEAGTPVLLVSRARAQGPYVSAGASGTTGGSAGAGGSGGGSGGDQRRGGKRRRR